jgi:heptosyltransferase I
MKIYISRLGMLGDTLFIVPALKNIRRTYPNAQIIVIVSPVGKAIIEETSLVDKIIVYNIYYPKWSAFWLKNKLKKDQADLYFNFDASEDYHTIFSSCLKSKKVYRMVRDYVDDSSIQLKQQSGEKLSDHIVDQYLSLLEKADIHIKETDYVFPSHSKKCDSFYAQYKNKLSPNGQKLIGIHAGNHVYNTNKLFQKIGFVPRAWSLPYYCQLAEKLATQHTNSIIVLTGGFYEKKMASTIEAHLQKKNLPVINMAGKTHSTVAFLGLLRTLSLMLCGDTGPMHMAAALEVPLISIFCSADPNDTGPKGNPKKSQVVMSDLPCNPCVHRVHEFQCPSMTNCVQDLTPGLILSKTTSLRKQYMEQS